MDIPVRVFINKILLFCEAKDVVLFGCTNRFFAIVAGHCSFMGPEMVRTGGWRSIYRKSQIFLWGWVTFSFSGVMRALICSLMCSHIIV